MFRLDDKVAVVTGASRGIGKAISIAMAGAGAKVALISRGGEALEKAADEIRQNGGVASAHPGDITDKEKIAATIQEVVDQYGALHIIVNNAGTTRDNLVLRMSDEEWNAPIDTNLSGTFNCIRAALRPMIKQRFGRIINITSVIGIMGNAGQANYAASKAGLIGLTKSVAKEYASRGITVNAIAPGYVATEMTSDISEEMAKKLIEGIPLGRMGEPEDVAPTAVFLASDAAGYITGQTLLVDGGMVM